MRLYILFEYRIRTECAKVAIETEDGCRPWRVVSPGLHGGSEGVYACIPGIEFELGASSRGGAGDVGKHQLARGQAGRESVFGRFWTEIEDDQEALVGLDWSVQGSSIGKHLRVIRIEVFVVAVDERKVLMVERDGLLRVPQN